MKKVLLVVGIIILVVLSRFTLFNDFISKGEVVFYDIMAKIAIDKGPFANAFKPADRDIVIVAVDDPSIQELANYPQVGVGTWPWRRRVWVDVLNYIEKGNPKAVLFDFHFPNVDDSRLDDWEFSNTLKKYDNVVIATSLNYPRFAVDEHYASSHKEKFTPKSLIKNLYNMFDIFGGEQPYEKPLKSDLKDIPLNDYIPTGYPLAVDMNDKEVEYNLTFFSHEPIADRYSKYTTLGVVNKVAEGDSILRRSRPVFKLVKNGETYYMPSLAFAGFLKVVGEDGNIKIEKGKVEYKNRVIPIDEGGSAFLSWHGKTGSNQQNYKYISVSDILLRSYKKEPISSDYFKDKIVLIGKTNSDIHATSVNPSTPGTEAVATALDNYINDTDITNPMSRKMLTKGAPWLEYLLAIVFCIAIVIIGIKSSSAFLGLLNSFMIVALYFLVAIFMYTYPDIRIWLPVAGPMYYIIITSTIVYSFRLHSESSKKSEVMNMFGKFVSPSVLNQLMQDSQGLVLKSTKKPITILFCDVKDFTSLSEKCNPEQLVDNLNELFNEIVNIIFANNGTVDKFVGDCVMAYWGDPLASEDDAFMAVKTALDIKKKVNELKITNTKAGKIVFDVKIGINTGDALLGLAGSKKIMSYTAMGDAVNVASRLESSCSKLKKDILISKTTYDQVKNKIVALEVEKVSLKGKDEKVLVYEPIGLIEKEFEENQEITEES